MIGVAERAAEAEGKAERVRVRHVFRRCGFYIFSRVSIQADEQQSKAGAQRPAT